MRRKQGNYHKPGYRSKANDKLKGYRVELQHDTHAAWLEAAARAGMSQRQAAEYVFRNFIRAQGIDIPAHPGPKTSIDPATLDC